LKIALFLHDYSLSEQNTVAMTSRFAEVVYVDLDADCRRDLVEARPITRQHIPPNRGMPSRYASQSVAFAFLMMFFMSAAVTPR
jgi:hypothetical protein